MIKSFKDKETARIWAGELSKKLPKEMQERGLRKLQELNAAGELGDLQIPVSNQLEKLKGNRKGQWSIRITKQWRLCFSWNEGHAESVEICDYH